VEWDERDPRLVGVCVASVQFQPHDARKTSDPTTCFRIRRCDGVWVFDCQGFCVMARRGWRIRKRLLPRLEVCFDVERDTGEKVLSGSRDPGFRDEATPLEHVRVVVEKVDYAIENFWREVSIGHSGFVWKKTRRRWIQGVRRVVGESRAGDMPRLHEIVTAYKLVSLRYWTSFGSCRAAPIDGHRGGNQQRFLYSHTGQRALKYRSIVPLLVIFGNKHPTKCLTTRSSLVRIYHPWASRTQLLKLNQEIPAGDRSKPSVAKKGSWHWCGLRNYIERKQGCSDYNV